MLVCEFSEAHRFFLGMEALTLKDNLKAVLPATPLAVVTDLWALLAGFVLPFWVVVGSFIGQIGRTLVVNPILYRNGILRRWTPGMTYF